MSAAPAFFVTFEGIDGCGKTTQLQLLSDAMFEQGVDYVRTREPGGTDGANIIRSLLVEGEPDRWDGETETLLHYAARRDHLMRVVRPALARGEWVLCDRFSDSTIAYQGYGHNISLVSIGHLEEFVVGDVAPKLTFVFDIDPKVALERAASRDGKEDRYEKMATDFHDRVRQGFLEIANHHKSRCVVLDATQTIEALHEQVLHAIATKLGFVLRPAKKVG